MLSVVGSALDCLLLSRTHFPVSSLAEDGLTTMVLPFAAVVAGSLWRCAAWGGLCGFEVPESSGGGGGHCSRCFPHHSPIPGIRLGLSIRPFFLLILALFSLCV